ncbi:MAG: MFS transporter [Candidatus Gastranaerophilales bacterium]|nr:MFS transporter [Candidatus Gastranaerophilales bacterium]
MKKYINKQTRALFGLSFGHFNIDLYAALLVPLYPLITTKLGINLALISSIIALGHLVSSMMQPVFGFIADKLRHRVFMIWGLVLTSIFIPLTIKAPSAKIFLCCLLLGMIGNAFFHPQVSALIKDFNKNNPDLSRAMGIFLGLGTIGYAIGPYIATFLVEKFGQNSLLYLIIPGVLSAIFLYFFVPKMPEKDCYVKENFFFIMKEILKNKVCMILMFISVVKSAVSISFGTYIPFLLKNHGFNLELTGLIVTLFFISGGIATIVSSKIEKYINANGVVVLSFLSILPLTLGFLYTIKTYKTLACVLFILTGFFILLSVGVILVQAQKTMPKYTGVISGVMQGFSWGLGALFLAPLGILGQNYGVEKILILMSSIAFIVGIFTLKNKYLKD